MPIQMLAGSPGYNSSSQLCPAIRHGQDLYVQECQDGKYSQAKKTYVYYDQISFQVVVENSKEIESYFGDFNIFQRIFSLHVRFQVQEIGCFAFQCDYCI